MRSRLPDRGAALIAVVWAILVFVLWLAVVGFFGWCIYELVEWVVHHK